MGLSDIFKSHKRDKSASSKGHDRTASGKSTASLIDSPPASPARPSRDDQYRTSPKVVADQPPRVSLSGLGRGGDGSAERDQREREKDLPAPPAPRTEGYAIGGGRGAVAGPSGVVGGQEQASIGLGDRRGEGDLETTSSSAAPNLSSPQNTAPTAPFLTDHHHHQTSNNHLSPTSANTSAQPPFLPEPEFKPFSISPSPSRAEFADDTAVAHQLDLMTLAASTHQTVVTNSSRGAGSELSSNNTIVLPAPSNIAPPPPGSFNHPSTVAPKVASAPNPSYLSTTETPFSPPYSPSAHLAAHTALFPPSAHAHLPSAPVPQYSHQPPSLQDQRAELFETIARDHHPRKVALGQEIKELFRTGGLKLHDEEGKGTIDWVEHWADPVVHERVQPVEERVYETRLNREINRYHIHPIVLPITNPDPSLTDPSQELHYFMDADGNWREIRGRALAEEIIRSSEAALLRSQSTTTSPRSAVFSEASLPQARKHDEPYRWEDDRAVKREREEMSRLAEGASYEVDGRGWEAAGGRRLDRTTGGAGAREGGFMERVEESLEERHARKERERRLNIEQSERTRAEQQQANVGGGGGGGVAI